MAALTNRFDRLASLVAAAGGTRQVNACASTCLRLAQASREQPNRRHQDFSCEKSTCRRPAGNSLAVRLLAPCRVRNGPAAKQPGPATAGPQQPAHRCQGNGAGLPGRFAPSSHGATARRLRACPGLQPGGKPSGPQARHSKAFRGITSRVRASPGGKPSGAGQALPFIPRCLARASLRAPRAARKPSSHEDRCTAAAQGLQRCAKTLPAAPSRRCASTPIRSPEP